MALKAPANKLTICYKRPAWFLPLLVPAGILLVYLYFQARLVCALLLMLGTLFCGMWRISRHPLIDEGYWKWFVNSPWRPGDRLPYGPVALGARDGALLLGLSLLGWFVMRPFHLLLPMLWLVGYTLLLLGVHVERKQFWGSFGVAVTLPLMMGFAPHRLGAWLFYIVACCIVAHLEIPRVLCIKRLEEPRDTAPDKLKKVRLVPGFEIQAPVRPPMLWGWMVGIVAAAWLWLGMRTTPYLCEWWVVFVEPGRMKAEELLHCLQYPCVMLAGGIPWASLVLWCAKREIRAPMGLMSFFSFKWLWPWLIALGLGGVLSLAALGAVKETHGIWVLVLTVVGYGPLGSWCCHWLERWRLTGNHAFLRMRPLLTSSSVNEPHVARGENTSLRQLLLLILKAQPWGRLFMRGSCDGLRRRERSSEFIGVALTAGMTGVVYGTARHDALYQEMNEWIFGLCLLNAAILLVILSYRLFFTIIPLIETMKYWGWLRQTPWVSTQPLPWARTWPGWRALFWILGLITIALSPMVPGLLRHGFSYFFQQNLEIQVFIMMMLLSIVITVWIWLVLTYALCWRWRCRVHLIMGCGVVALQLYALPQHPWIAVLMFLIHFVVVNHGMRWAIARWKNVMNDDVESPGGAPDLPPLIHLGAFTALSPYPPVARPVLSCNITYFHINCGVTALHPLARIDPIMGPATIVLPYTTLWMVLHLIQLGYGKCYSPQTRPLFGLSVWVVRAWWPVLKTLCVAGLILGSGFMAFHWLPTPVAFGCWMAFVLGVAPRWLPDPRRFWIAGPYRLHTEPHLLAKDGIQLARMVDTSPQPFRLRGRSTGGPRTSTE